MHLKKTKPTDLVIDKVTYTHPYEYTPVNPTPIGPFEKIEPTCLFVDSHIAYTEKNIFKSKNKCRKKYKHMCKVENFKVSELVPPQEI